MTVFTFKKASCVVVGTFNIYIIQPKILGEMGVIPPEAKCSLLSDLTQPGHQFKFEDSTWLVRPDRFSVESTHFSYDCGSKVSKLLENLPWTPIMAVGANVTYAADKSAADSLPKEFRLPEVSELVTQRTCHVAKKHGQFTINIQASVADELNVDINCHFDFASDRAKLQQKDINAKARVFCDQFKDLLNESISAAEAILDGKLKP